MMTGAAMGSDKGPSLCGLVLVAVLDDCSDYEDEEEHNDSVRGLSGLGLKHLLAAFAPFRAMLDDPVCEGVFETDVSASFFGFDPFMLEDLFAFGLKLSIERRV